MKRVMSMNRAAMQRFLPVIVALAFVPAAAASTTMNPPGLIGAQKACLAQGLSVGDSGYAICLKEELAGTSTTAPVTGGGSTTTPVSRAQQACAQKGLVPGSNGFMTCVNKTMTVAARKTCVTKGLSQGSSGFSRCVKQHLQAGTK